MKNEESACDAMYEFQKGVSVETTQKHSKRFLLFVQWRGRFRIGDFNVEDQPRSGWLSGIVCALVQEA